jgi:UV DNA damage endonuclease
MEGDDGEARHLRLGFAVKVLGQPDLKSHDTRRWQSGPHLRNSIEHLRAIFAYLERRGIRMYRMSSDVAPYATHPDMPQFHRQVEECAPDLDELGRMAHRLDLRLSFHPSQYILLNALDPAIVAKSIADLVSQAEILDRMGLGPEAVLVVHAGAAYGDKAEGRRRWAETYRRLPEPVRRRLVLEHDDLRFSAADVLWIHEQTGVRLIFDHQHFWCFNPEGLEMLPTLRRILASWPADVRPKVHFSSPRTDVAERRRRVGRRVERTLALPPLRAHADLVDPIALEHFLEETARGLSFDVMLEAKAKDLALLRVRDQLAARGIVLGAR